jgi:hypothetical protein
MTTVAVAHYPEGAGHATRMVAVANALRDRGHVVELAGGGPGRRFAELHGYEEFVPAPVDYIGDYQGSGAGWLARVVTNSLPRSLARVRDYIDWLGKTDPAALVTDDMFAAMAAPAAGVPLYVLTHNAAFLYRALVERTVTAFLTRAQVRFAERFLYPAVWPPVPGDPEGVERIPPVALDPGRSPGPPDEGTDESTCTLDESDSDGSRVDPTDPPDVLVVPSHFSTGFDGVVERLRREGLTVTLVGHDGWEPVASLLPLIRASGLVVCSGYSTMMEAAVAGTPCVVRPFTDEQRGVARLVTRNDVPGFCVAECEQALVRTVRGWLPDPPEVTAIENGARAAAKRVLGDLDAA